MHDATAWLLDANHTAVYGFRGVDRDQQDYITTLLADGIDIWLTA